MNPTASSPAAAALPASCDADLWDLLLHTPDLDGAHRDWMLSTVTLWPGERFDDDFTRDDAWTSMLASPFPLASDDLCHLLSGDGPTSRAATRALLAHPACDVAVVATLLGRKLTVDGALVSPDLPAPYDEQQRILDRKVLGVVEADPRLWVRALLATRRAGIGHWNPDLPQQRDRLAAHGAAHRAWLTAMQTLEADGDAATWAAVLALAGNGPVDQAAVDAAAALHYL